MKEKLEALLREGAQKIDSAKSESELQEIKGALLGKQGAVTEMLKEIPKLDVALRPEMGKAVNNVKNIRNAKKAIEKAFRNQVEGKGFSLIEVVSTCPTNWGKTPQAALEWLEENMLPYYPLGVYKDKDAAKEETK